MQVTQSKNQGLQKRQESGLTLEQQAIEASQDLRKLGSAADIEIKQTLAYVFALIGLTNFPDDAQQAVLFEFMRSNFRAFSLQEIRRAFDMAMAGKLEADTNHYQSFNAAYFARIMNAYKAWAVEVRKQYDKPQIEYKAPEVTVDQWRAQIQNVYEAFNAKSNYRLWPAEMYDQLVADGFIQHGWHQKYLSDAKNIICGDVHLEIAQEQDDVKTGDMERLLSQYRSGERDGEITLLAKQMSIKEFFEFGKTIDTKAIYEKV